MSKLKGYVNLKLRSNSNIWTVFECMMGVFSPHTDLCCTTSHALQRDQSGMGWMTNALI